MPVDDERGVERVEQRCQVVVVRLHVKAAGLPKQVGITPGREQRRKLAGWYGYTGVVSMSPSAAAMRSQTGTTRESRTAATSGAGTTLTVVAEAAISAEVSLPATIVLGQAAVVAGVDAAVGAEGQPVGAAAGLGHD